MLSFIIYTAVVLSGNTVPLEGYVYTDEPTVMRRETGWTCGNWRATATNGAVRACEPIGNK